MHDNESDPALSSLWLFNHAYALHGQVLIALNAFEISAFYQQDPGSLEDKSNRQAPYECMFIICTYLSRSAARSTARPSMIL
jgi:hypothetical protein